MSDSIRVQRSGIGKIPSPQPLPLTPSEAETLRAAVLRIIRASEAVGSEGPRPVRTKSPRR